MSAQLLVLLLAGLWARAQGGATPSAPAGPAMPSLAQRALGALGALLEEVPGAECRRQGAVVLEGLRNYSEWAFTMADATAKVPAGLLRGNLRALGDVDECLAVEAETVRGKFCLASVHVDSDSAPVARLLDVAMGGRRNLEFRHRVADLGNGVVVPNGGYTPEFSRGEVGVCVPAACAAADVEAALRGVARRLEGVTALRFDVRVAEQDCQTRGSRLRPLGAAHYAFVAFCSVFDVLVSLGTIWNVYFDNKPLHDKSTAEAALSAFSLRTSWKRLTSARAEELGCIAGLRSLSTLLMIYLHELFYVMREPAINKTFLIEVRSSLRYSPFVTGWTIVDGIFTISGTVYSYAVANTIITGRCNYASNLLYRLIRLAPVYYVILWFYATFLECLGNGPGWDSQINYNVETCRKNWIFNVFFLNNYINTMHMCMVQSWFLATDMQFFILAPLVLVPLYCWRRGQALALALIMVSVGVTASTIISMETPDLFPVYGSDQQIGRYMLDNHAKTHTHSSSYLVGLYLGYILHQDKIKKVYKNKALMVIGWIACVSAFAVVSFGTHFMLQKSNEHSLVGDAAYSAVSRLLWAIAVAWIIFACHTGYGGLMNRFLNCYAFRVLSRLSYATNMIHFIVLLHNSGRRRVPISISDFGLIQMFIGDYVVGGALGVIVFLVIESPIYLVSRLYVLKGLTKKPSPPSVPNDNKIK